MFTDSTISQDRADSFNDYKSNRQTLRRERRQLKRQLKSGRTQARMQAVNNRKLARIQRKYGIPQNTPPSPQAVTAPAVQQVEPADLVQSEEVYEEAEEYSNFSSNRRARRAAVAKAEAELKRKYGKDWKKYRKEAVEQAKLEATRMNSEMRNEKRQANREAFNKRTQNTLGTIIEKGGAIAKDIFKKKDQESNDESKGGKSMANAEFGAEAPENSNKKTYIYIGVGIALLVIGAVVYFKFIKK